MPFGGISWPSRGSSLPFGTRSSTRQWTSSVKVAVFTLNVGTYDPADDTVANRWDTTEVHCRASGGWEMVHAHWSLMESGS